MATASAAATVPPAGTFACRPRAGTGRSKSGKFLGQFGGTALWALRSTPIRRPDEDFAVAFALPAMKFIDWHDQRELMWHHVYVNIHAEGRHCLDSF
jgi:hypothetical protein